MSLSLTEAQALISHQAPLDYQQPLRPVEQSGSDHQLFRLGERWVIRLPRSDSAAEQHLKERAWLLSSRGQLPLETPEPVFLGQASERYPYPWSIYTWIEGQRLDRAALTDVPEAARRLGCCLRVLHGLETEGGPEPGRHNFFRGVPLKARDEDFQEALTQLRGRFPTDRAQELWQRAIESPVCQGRRWVHGDLQPGNLLMRGGRLCAVIDFGGVAVADPAVDVMAAWTVFDETSRRVFREALGVDDQRWLRGRAWALLFGVLAWPFYEHRLPDLAAMARRSAWQAVGQSLQDGLAATITD